MSNGDKLWMFLLNMDLSNSQSHKLKGIHYSLKKLNFHLTVYEIMTEIYYYCTLKCTSQYNNNNHIFKKKNINLCFNLYSSVLQHII